MAGQNSKYFTWTFRSLDEGPVMSSIGLPLDAKSVAEPSPHVDLLILVGGANVEKHSSARHLAVLRSFASRGIPILGLCTAAYTLAAAGLMSERKVSLHWRYQASFSERFFDVVLLNSPFYWDGKFGTSAGGISAIGLNARRD